jgi:hypothetical protein
MANKAPAPNRRPRFLFGASRWFDCPSCAPPASPAAVGEAQRQGAHEFMRILAYAMLILGFVWICFCQFEVRGITRAVMAAQAGKVPKQLSYSLEDVVTGIHDAAADMADRIPFFSIGALIMLGGGMVLDMESRHRRVPS